MRIKRASRLSSSVLMLLCGPLSKGRCQLTKVEVVIELAKLEDGRSREHVARGRKGEYDVANYSLRLTQ